VYLLVGASALLVAGPAAIAATPTPLATAVDAAGAAWALPVVRAGAIVASLGSLLALIAGVGRTTLAMAREGDMPLTLAAVDAHHSVPHHAEVAIAVAVVALVAITDLRNAIGFSSFGVLVYYAIANAAAFTQPASERRWPRAVNLVGFVGCLLLVATLPPTAIVAGIAMFAVGLAARALVIRGRRAAV
jgi:APA family basic amino acid/polyamine antiporter